MIKSGSSLGLNVFFLSDTIFKMINSRDSKTVFNRDRPFSPYVHKGGGGGWGGGGLLELRTPWFLTFFFSYMVDCYMVEGISSAIYDIGFSQVWHLVMSAYT